MRGSTSPQIQYFAERCRRLVDPVEWGLPVSKSGVNLGASSTEEQFHLSPSCAARQAARARRAAEAT